VPILKDVLQQDLWVVFCGTAPAKASAKAGAYYAHPGNRFWSTLHEIGLTPRRLDPQECWDLNALGLGLTDLAKHRVGVDSELRMEDFDVRALESKLRRYRPRILAFTSKHAARQYFGRNADFGLQAQRFGDTRLFVLNSTSGRATGHWKGARHWHALAQLVKGARAAEAAVRIRDALPQEAETLAAIALEAKAHWGYSAEALRKWRKQLTVTPGQLRRYAVQVAQVGEELAGFVMLCREGTRFQLRHLWVRPAFMGRGIGAMLLRRALQVAQTAGARSVEVESDPNAAGFYARQGGKRRGAVPAPLPDEPKRVLPRFVFRTR